MDLKNGRCKNPGACYDDNVVTPGDDGSKYVCYGRQQGWATGTVLDSRGYLLKCSGSLTSVSDVIEASSWWNISSRLWRDYTVKSDISQYGCSRAEYTPDPINLIVKRTDQSPLSPLNIIRTITNFLYYFAIFYFIVLMLVNAISYVRSAEDPSELKKIKESLFNTIAGFLFVLLSGSVIVYLLTQIG
ncbi:MAG: hypothetical protein EBV07_00700 [Proteobacteria bacterium]|nr:hypothetical protein [Pseudomonadota bacterium]